MPLIFELVIVQVDLCVSHSEKSMLNEVTFPGRSIIITLEYYKILLDIFGLCDHLTTCSMTVLMQY